MQFLDYRNWNNIDHRSATFTQHPWILPTASFGFKLGCSGYCLPGANSPEEVHDLAAAARTGDLPLYAAVFLQKAFESSYTKLSSHQVISVVHVCLPCRLRMGGLIIYVVMVSQTAFVLPLLPLSFFSSLSLSVSLSLSSLSLFRSTWFWMFISLHCLWKSMFLHVSGLELFECHGYRGRWAKVSEDASAVWTVAIGQWRLVWIDLGDVHATQPYPHEERQPSLDDAYWPDGKV